MNTTTTRRTAMGAIAAAALMPSSAIAAEPDPIFVAIAVWRAAEKHHEQTFERDEWDEDGESSSTCAVYHESAMEMAETVPTTLAGAAALAEIVAVDISIGPADWQYVAPISAAKAMRELAGGKPAADLEWARRNVEAMS